MKRVILASASPRRRDLLGALIDNFDVMASNVPEPTTGEAAIDAVRLADAKAMTIAKQFPHAVVIGADTIVQDATRQYGKPVDAADAMAMWDLLGGRAHRVVTGIAVAHGGRTLTARSESRVELSRLSFDDVERYVGSGRPMDKAGAYAIQDEDVPTVTRLEGCYCCVVGLPLWRLSGLLAEAGLECRSPADAFERCAVCPERSEVPALAS